MRQHFHRCANLRVVSIDASEISGERKGGGAIVDELCQAKSLARCVGLADCDVLTNGQKRELLVARVTQLRGETGGFTAIGDLGGERGREIEQLARELIDERDEILAANQILLAEATAAFDARPDDAPLGSPDDLARPDLALQPPALRMARLDAIDRALEAMRIGPYGRCARRERLIALDRLRAAPDTQVCGACARTALAAT
jgi:RNA polymerase-binding transcription factor DksA